MNAQAQMHILKSGDEAMPFHEAAGLAKLRSASRLQIVGDDWLAIEFTNRKHRIVDSYVAASLIYWIRDQGVRLGFAGRNGPAVQYIA